MVRRAATRSTVKKSKVTRTGGAKRVRYRSVNAPKAW